VFADANPKELQIRESVLKKAGKRARALAGRVKPSSIHDRSVQNIGAL